MFKLKREIDLIDLIKFLILVGGLLFAGYTFLNADVRPLTPKQIVFHHMTTEQGWHVPGVSIDVSILNQSRAPTVTALSDVEVIAKGTQGPEISFTWFSSHMISRDQKALQIKAADQAYPVAIPSGTLMTQRLGLVDAYCYEAETDCDALEPAARYVAFVNLLADNKATDDRSVTLTLRLWFTHQSTPVDLTCPITVKPVDTQAMTQRLWTAFACETA